VAWIKLVSGDRTYYLNLDRIKIFELETKPNSVELKIFKTAIKMTFEEAKELEKIIDKAINPTGLILTDFESTK